MKQNSKNEIATRDELIEGLMREGRMKDEIIQLQKEMIQALEDRNIELEKIMKEMLSQLREQKG